jgi:hypothetical protein
VSDTPRRFTVTSTPYYQVLLTGAAVAQRYPHSEGSVRVGDVFVESDHGPDRHGDLTGRIEREGGPAFVYLGPECLTEIVEAPPVESPAVGPLISEEAVRRAASLARDLRDAPEWEALLLIARAIERGVS